MLDVTSEFTANNAYQLALMSLLAYEDEYTLRNQLNGLRYQGCEFIEQDEVQCFIAIHAKHIVVSFRGTEPDKLEDWITDLSYELQTHPWGCAHSGFQRALNKVWPFIRLILKQHKDKPVFVTGHSMGADLAGLCVAQMWLSMMDFQATYNYGQPRFCSKAFAANYDRYLKTRTFRMVNNNDVFTRIPPTSWNYHHVGTLKYFKESGELTGKLSEWAAFKDRLRGRAEDVLEWGADGIKDHNISMYIWLCEQLLEPRSESV